jgi:hypothetical protein
MKLAGEKLAIALESMADRLVDASIYAVATRNDSVIEQIRFLVERFSSVVDNALNELGNDDSKFWYYGASKKAAEAIKILEGKQ